MCLFLTFATTEAAPVSCPDCQVEPFDNERSGHVYPDGLRVYCITKGGCSCDLVTTFLETRDPNIRAALLRRKYKKKGWSNSKIDRAVHDAMRSANNLYGFRAGVAQYLTHLAAQLGQVQFIVHHHSHEFATEPFEIRDTVRLSTLHGSEPFAPKEDVRYILYGKNQG